MMKRKVFATLVASCALVLSACGGSSPSHSAAPTRQSVAKATGHQCTPDNTYQQCILVTQPHKLSLPPVGVSPLAYGIDFAWSCPNPSGHQFGASYLSNSSKDWTRGCINWYHSAHAGTVFVWETSSTRATNGYSAGFSDARSASAELAALGQSSNQPFTLAIDFDANGSDVAQYFSGASHAEPGRVNAYGGYRPLLYLFQHGLVGHLNWQTYAWSGGSWLPSSIAPLEQYLNSNAVDYDRAIAANYGQSPSPTPVNPVCTPFTVRLTTSACKALRVNFASWGRARDSSLRAYHKRRCTQPVLGSELCHTFASRVVYFQRLRDKYVARPVCFGSHAQKGAPACQIVRSEVAIWSRAVFATRKAEDNNTCGGTQTPERRHVCLALYQRQRYFQNRIDTTLKEF